MQQKYSARATEESLLAGLLWRLLPEVKDRYDQCRSSHRFLSYPRKQLVIFQFVDGKPQPVDLLECSEIALSMKEGLSSTWFDKAGNTHVFGHVPTEIYHGVFINHTFDSNLQYFPYKGVYQVRTPLVHRAIHSYKHPVDGAYYIMERTAFDTEFA